MTIDIILAVLTFAMVYLLLTVQRQGKQIRSLAERAAQADLREAVAEFSAEYSRESKARFDRREAERVRREGRA